ATAVPTIALCASPVVFVITPARGGVAIAENVVVSAPAVAVIVFAPALVPSVQPLAAAIPSALVVCVPPPFPPPEATEKATLTPATGTPFTSVTRTLGDVATAVPTVAV